MKYNFPRLALALENHGITPAREDSLQLVEQACDVVERFNAAGLEIVDDAPPVVDDKQLTLPDVQEAAIAPVIPATAVPGPVTAQKTLPKRAPPKMAK